MSCEISQGILAQVCDDKETFGGAFERIFIGNLDDFASITANNGAIDTITLNAYATLYSFYGRKNGNTFSEELELADGGGKTYNVSAELRVRKFDVTTRQSIQQLAKAGKLVVWIPTKAGSVEVIGIAKASTDGLALSEGAEVTALTRASGQALTDNPEFVITISAVHYEPAISQTNEGDSSSVSGTIAYLESFL